MRKIEIELSDLLDLVNAAESFGYADDVLMASLAKWAGNVTDTEISAYAHSLSNESGYGTEDRVEAVARLTEWRGKHKRSVIDT